ncbi:hypothetical protein [Crossiella sp. S99.2]|uniref:hypothetical protein n=1 Tax=Crossiella sp. S99.2 TaxID=2936272 RepID=UPI001FFF9D9E|nr:hypothetical protein [Crossiella sp. S99.2]MCK2238079.1 hypothetical protein [Crossiella sp. S99.2]
MTTPFRGAFAPLRWLFQLLQLSAIPALVLGLTWWLVTPASSWFAPIALVVGLYQLFVFYVWVNAVRGQVRSLSRGPHVIRGERHRRSRRRKR